MRMSGWWPEAAHHSAATAIASMVSIAQGFGAEQIRLVAAFDHPAGDL